MAKLPSRIGAPSAPGAMAWRYANQPLPVPDKAPDEVEAERMKSDANLMRKASGKSLAELLKSARE